jgi:hypothetical protein
MKLFFMTIAVLLAATAFYVGSGAVMELEKVVRLGIIVVAAVVAAILSVSFNE